MKFNLSHLKEKLVDSEYIESNKDITCNDVKEMLINRFNEIDFKEAKEDVIPFIKDTSVLDIWSKEFFIDITIHKQICRLERDIWSKEFFIDITSNLISDEDIKN